MPDNRLNLIVAFTGIDKLTPALKNIVGLGKSGRQSLQGLMAEQRRLNKEIADYDRKMKGASGSVNALWNAQKRLMVQQEAVGASILRQKRLMAIDGRTARMTAAGSAMVGSGTSSLMTTAILAAPIYEMAKSAGEIEGLTNRLRVLGLGDRAVADLRAYADAMNVAGSSTQDNMRYLVEAQGVFRESGAHSLTEQVAGAKLMAPMMARLMTTSKALGHELTEDQERYFLRFVEQAGGVNDPRRAAALTDGLFRAIQSSGGNVDPSNYQAFMARAGTAGMRLSARSMFADFEPLIAELHESAGVGLQSAYARMNGMVKNSTGAAELLRLGVWDKSAVELNSLGGVKRFIGGRNPLSGDMADTLATSPVDFYLKLRDQYQKGGVKDFNRENMLLFGRTGGALFNLIEKQMPTILKSRDAYQRTQGLDKAYNQTKDSFFGAGGQMNAAWKNFLVVAGTKGGLLDMVTAGLRGVTSGLKALTSAANNHPMMFKAFATAYVSLVALKGVLAVVRIVFGTILQPIATLWGWFSKARLLLGVAEGFGGIATALEVLTGPVGWAIAGVTALATGAIMIYRNWSGISAFFQRHWTAIRNFMLGAFVVLFPVLAQLIVYIHKHWGAIAGFFQAVGKSIYGYAIAPLIAVGKYVGNWVGTWVGYGAQLIGGLIRGIVNGTASVLMTIVHLAEQVGGKFAAELGIQSPSRVFMAYGGHITHGLALGVDRGAHRPMASMQRLARGMSSSFAPAGAHGGHGQGKVEIHVHQRPGEDGHALAHRVAAIIDRNHRNDRLRSYRDDF